MRRVRAGTWGSGVPSLVFVVVQNGDGGWGRIDGSEVLTAKREGLRAIAVG